MTNDYQADAAFDAKDEGRKEAFMDEDRMVNEGLGGGQVTFNNGFIGDTTTDSMDAPESVMGSESDETVLKQINRSFGQ